MKLVLSSTTIMIIALQLITTLSVTVRLKGRYHGKTVYRSMEQSIHKDRNNTFRVPIQFIEDQGDWKKTFWFRLSDLDFNPDLPDDFQFLVDCYKEMDPMIRPLLLDPNGARKSDANLLREIKEDHDKRKWVRAVLIEMTVEELQLEEKQDFVREMGTILYFDAPNTKLGAIKLRLAINAIEGDSQKMRIVSSLVPFTFCVEGLDRQAKRTRTEETASFTL